MMSGRKRQPAQRNVDINADSNTIGEQGPEALESWQQVPTEIWLKIFDDLNENQRDVLNARETCRYWRDITDEHVEFKVILNDEKQDWTTMSHVRVKSCSVHHFKTTFPPNQQLYKDMNLLKNLQLNNQISRENFIWLAERTPHLEHLTLDRFFLNIKSILKASNNHEQLVLTNFWNRIKQLEFSSFCIHQNDVPEWYANFRELMSTTMGNLKSCSFNMQSFHVLHWFVRFLSQNPSVTDVNFRLFTIGSWNVESDPPDHIDVKDLGQIQLKTMKVVVRALSVDEKELITSIINSQKVLVNLEICETPSTYREMVLYFDDLRDVIKNNYSTLTKAVFRCLKYTSDLDASIFEKCTGLKTLAIYRETNSNGSPVHQIKNLVCLPQSLEKLSIDGLNFDENDLTEILTSKQLENVRSLKLVGGEGYHLSRELLENLTNKVKLGHFTLGPVVIKGLQFMIEREEKFVCLKNGKKLQASQSNLFDENSAILNFSQNNII